MNYRILIPLLLFSFVVRLPAGAQATKIHFKHISNDDGLSNSTVEAIFQDHRGFIWLGTRDGLNRYDGRQLHVYRHQPSDSNSLCDNYITSIAEDAGKDLWIGTLNGLSRLNPASNRFINYRKQLSNNQISSVFRDRRNRMWVASFGGAVHRFDEDRQVFIPVPLFRDPQHRSGETHVYILYEDSRGNLWAGAESGLYQFGEKEGWFEWVPGINQDEKELLSIRDLAEDKSGNLLLATENNGLIIYNAQYRTARRHTHQPTRPNSISSNLLRALLVTQNGDIWTGSVNGGLDLFNPGNESFQNFQYVPEDPGSLSQRTVSALLEDRQGNIWIGTHRGGVNLYTPGAQKFRLYRQQPDGNSLSYNDVKTFCEDRNGNIWVGTDGGGLNLFNKKTQSFRHFRFDPFHANTLASNEVLSITEDREGKLWIGTWGGGLCQLNADGKTFTRYTGPRFIQHIYEDSKERLWIATYYEGLHLFDRKTGTFTRINRSETGKTGIAGNNIISIAEDRENNLWFGTDDGGLNRLDGRTGEFSAWFNHDEKKPDIRVLTVDSKGQLWVGQSGLFLFDKKQNKFQRFAEDSELNELFIKGIVEDNNGQLWISSSNGVFRLNPETSEIRHFNAVDGLQGREFEANAFLRTRDGEVYFGGVNGFNCFYPNEINTNTFIPPVYITGFNIENKLIIGGPGHPNLDTDISFAETINLSWKEATFSFGFAALNYTASENNRFLYKLEGWDRDWIAADGERKVTYTNVTPGRYTFRVKASNNDGLWNEAGRELTIIITPPFWQTWWFRLLVAAIVLTGAYYFIRFKRKVQLERFAESQREKMHEMQLQFFTNISHEFRTPLTLIMGPVEKLLKENPDSQHNHSYQVIQRNANRLLQLINELMDFRKAESGALRLQVMRGSLNHFLHEIADQFSEMASQKKIRFNIKVDDIGRETWFDRQVLEKIVINLLSNSFKFTASGGEVTLEVLPSLDPFKPSFENSLQVDPGSQKNSFVYLRVTDNGIGISKESFSHLFERYYRVSDAHMGSGIGLAFVKTLTQLHKGNIQVFSEKGKGTEFIVGIPMSHKDYDPSEIWTQSQPANASLDSLSFDKEEKNQTASIGSTNENNGSLPVILVADDHEELRGFLKEALEGEFNVLEAANGKDAWEIAKEHFPDIVISDIMMPVMDGIQFCKELKQSPETAHIPFILLTAKASLEAQLEGTGSGADHYFAKPINAELLLQTIRNILSQKQKLRERYRKDHHAELREMAHSNRDREFMDSLLQIIEANLGSPELDIDFVCTQAGMSRTKLYNKVKNITGQSVGDFIRSLRLRKAAALMTETDLSLTDIMYCVGIQTQSYFSKAFKAEFGKTPTQFLKELQELNREN